MGRGIQNVEKVPIATGLSVTSAGVYAGKIYCRGAKSITVLAFSTDATGNSFAATPIGNVTYLVDADAGTGEQEVAAATFNTASGYFLDSGGLVSKGGGVGGVVHIVPEVNSGSETGVRIQLEYINLKFVATGTTIPNVTVIAFIDYGGH